MKLKIIEKDTRHTDAECTYSIIQSPDGSKFLQLDTYGSKSRKIPGKVSQSIRFSPRGLAQLKQILDQYF
jgi:hypothetical protein